MRHHNVYLNRVCRFCSEQERAHSVDYDDALLIVCGCDDETYIDVDEAYDNADLRRTFRARP